MIEVRVMVAGEKLTLRVNANISLKDLLLKITKELVVVKQLASDKQLTVMQCRHELVDLKREDLNRTLASLGINKAENVLYASLKAPENPQYNLSFKLLEEKAQNLLRQQEQEALMAQTKAFSDKFPWPIFQIILDYVSSEPKVLKALLGAQQAVNAYYSHQLARLEKLICLPEEEQNKRLPLSEMHLRPLIPRLVEAKENPDQLLEKAIKTNDLWLLSLTLRYGANLNRAFLRAAASGCEAIVSVLLAVPGVDVNYIDDHGYTALLWAVAEDYAAIFSTLLAVPEIDVNHVDGHGNSSTALLLAAENGRVAMVSALLAAPGIDVNHVDSRGNTALLLAARYGHVAIVAALLAIPGIDVNRTDRYDVTALQRAAATGRAAIVAALLAAPGINVNQVGRKGRTALQWAARDDRHVGIVAALRAATAKIKMSDEKIAGNKPQEIKKPHARVVNPCNLLVLKQSSEVVELQEQKITLSAILSAFRCKQRSRKGESHIEVHLEGCTLQKKLELRNHFELFFDQIFPEGGGARPHADVSGQKTLVISGITLEALKKLLEVPIPESRCSIS